MPNIPFRMHQCRPARPPQPAQPPAGPTATSSPHDRQPPQDRQPRTQWTHRDWLTGLANRSGLLAALTEVLVDEPHDQVAVLYCDVDHFRRVNDGWGHEAGDELLQALAGHLAARLPQQCTAARLSGGEFVLACSRHRAEPPTTAGPLTRRFRGKNPVSSTRFSPVRRPAR